MSFCKEGSKIVIQLTMKGGHLSVAVCNTMRQEKTSPADEHT